MDKVIDLGTQETVTDLQSIERVADSIDRQVRRLLGLPDGALLEVINAKVEITRNEH